MHSAATDIPHETPLELMIVLEQAPVPPLASSAIQSAVRAHFAYEADRVNRLLIQQRRCGRVALAGGLTVLVL